MNESLLRYSAPYSCSDGSGLSHNSVTTKYWNNNDGEVRAAALTSAALTLCFILVGLPSNLLIIVSILRQRLYTQPTHILLLNLTIADLLMCVLVMPFTVISGFAEGFIFGNSDSSRCRVCQLGVVLSIFTTLSLHILAVLSVDRFIFIKYPMKYHEIVTVKRATVTIICLWVFCITISLLPLFGFGDVIFGFSTASCTIRFDSKTRVTKNINYAVFITVESLVLPLLVLVFTNIWIICIVQKQIRKMYTIKNTIACGQEEFIKNIKSKLSRTKYSKQIQLIKTFGAIFLANVVTWLPLFFYIIQAAIVGNNSNPAFENAFVYITFISYPVLHPTIQACLIPDVRRYFFGLLCKVLCWHGKCKGMKEVCCLKCTCGKVSDPSEHSNECFLTQQCLCLDFLRVAVLPIREEINITQDNV